MRILIISDIHANLAAFEAVLAAARGEWEEMWFLGDLLGYGPDPNACGALLREQNPVLLTGNHDWAVLGKLEISSFNVHARQAIEWTQEVLDVDLRDYLLAQPARLVREPYLLAHASPRQPVWEYILDSAVAAANFEQMDGSTPIALVGHTHVPVLYTRTYDGGVRMAAPVYNEPVSLAESRFIVNPGSVGQPRDGDPRAAYALLDTEKLAWVYRRVAYPVGETQQRMREAGLPERLIARLEYGW
jgi:diadenosine tetraphosphatase ApaH/serine/threonine PP2A family protein phosphatase